MKPLPLLGMAALALTLTACKEKKDDTTGAATATAKSTKSSERPAKGRPAISRSNLPYPEGLKLIATAEQTSADLRAAVLAYQNATRAVGLNEIIGRAGTQPQASPEIDQAKATADEARKAHAAALLALASHQGSEFEQAEIQAFHERDRLRKQLAAAEFKVANTRAGHTDPAVLKALEDELAANKEKLAALEAKWKDVSADGWRDRVETAAE